jgi:hypothetical protein
MKRWRLFQSKMADDCLVSAHSMRTVSVRILVNWICMLKALVVVRVSAFEM